MALALRINPKFPKVLDRRSRVYERLGDYDNALIDAVAACVLDSFKNESLLAHVEQLLKSSSEQKATEIFSVPAPSTAAVRLLIV